jgi:acetyl-CoA carboxylase carboxyltransferase component
MGARHMVSTLRCFMCFWQRMVSPHCRQTGTFNLLLHDDERAVKATRSIASVANQGRSICLRAARSKAAEDFEDQKLI